MTAKRRFEATVGEVLFFFVGVVTFAWGLCVKTWIRITSGALAKPIYLLTSRRPKRETAEIMSDTQEFITAGELLTIIGLFLITFGLFIREASAVSGKKLA